MSDGLGVSDWLGMSNRFVMDNWFVMDNCFMMIDFFMVRNWLYLFNNCGLGVCDLFYRLTMGRLRFWNFNDWFFLFNLNWSLLYLWGFNFFGSSFLRLFWDIYLSKCRLTSFASSSSASCRCS
jgi:hypothetical protein